MWTVVHITSNKPQAEMMKSFLENQGMIVRLRPVGIPHARSSGTIEIMVPESEAEEAHQILTDGPH